MREGQEELRNFMQTLQPLAEQQQEIGDEGDGAFDFSDFLTEGEGDPAFDTDAFTQQFTQAVEQAVESKVAPLQQQQQEFVREQQMREMVAEFPDLGDPEFVTQVANVTGQFAQVLGHPELAQEPGFMRLVYLAGLSADRAGEEAGDDPGVATLEGGGGAGAGGVSGQDVGEIFANQRKGGAALPFP